MKKRGALMGLTVLMTLLIVLSGCTPDAYSVKNELNALPAPKNLKADVTNEGLVILKWDVVKDAVGYDIYRRDTVSGITEHLKVINGLAENYYLDFVDFDNLLVDKRGYTYSVVARSRNSTDAVTNPGTTVVQNGQADVNAKPLIPGRADFGKKNTKGAFDPDGTFSLIDETKVVIEEYSDQNTPVGQKDEFLVQFPSKPNLNYTVSYIYGGSTEADSEAWTFIRDLGNPLADTDFVDGKKWFQEYRTAKFPVMGGPASVTVKAVFPNGDYYAQYDIKTVPTTLAEVFTLAAPGNPGASRGDFYEYAKARVFWDNDVEGATGYDVYWAELNPGDAVGEDSIDNAGNSLEVKSDWKKVGAAPQLVNGGTTWQVIVDAPVELNMIFGIVAKNETGAKASAMAFAKLDDEAPDARSALYISAPTSAPTGTVVTASWNYTVGKEDKLEYELSWAEIKGKGKNDVWVAGKYDYDLVTAWTNIPVTAPTVKTGDYVVTVSSNDRPFNMGSAYAFRLVTKRGNLKSDPVYAYLTNREDPGYWRTVLGFSFDDAAPVHQNANIIRLNLTGGAPGFTYRTGKTYSLTLNRTGEGNLSGSVGGKLGEIAKFADTTANYGLTKDSYDDIVPDMAAGYFYYMDIGDSPSNSSYTNDDGDPLVDTDMYHALGYIAAENWGLAGAKFYQAADDNAYDGTNLLPAKSLVIAQWTNNAIGIGAETNIAGLPLYVTYPGQSTAVPITVKRIDGNNSHTYYITMPNLTGSGDITAVSVLHKTLGTTLFTIP